ncbi:galactose-1-epimerase [Aggregatibacter actinomycetemcomitans]|uniref:Aldose 1-epimerase n=3 Tax=Aggregatibacter actinomycetemcomitans TaxID=714 RepID=A0A142G1A0_AGGAC|nr:galactose-1-epimerase [Aggregatibacter actinomycetemcomitans]AFI87293.1 galactose-1-epimerase [Aggregatibacter actinomycetemcomitans D7S-1]AMQ94430.1 galactose-1-epimerase [Aggregatibacter actinomycetemcomitans]ANU81459.1 galactose-1-epimerase [Aggregatibacter actinomycetemcomitans]EKX97875.1 galactose mutarotase [Aggregatibacter actinomycetemcomitans Y4]KND83029.1 galactose-1-epimerase [Aggregatibacter actinomycetemcomitans serotype a str. H5P1]
MLEQLTQGNAPDGLPFNLFTLKNAQGMCAQFTDWGAAWTSCCVPVNGELREVLLGCKLEDYPIQQAYLGVSVGRYANRIANAQFPLNGKVVRLTANQGKHQLHGGNGFDKRRWMLEKCGENFVCFSLHSTDGDQGFPGNVKATVTYTLTEDNAVKIEYAAQSDQDTALNLTNHAYFNLENAMQGADVRNHSLRLNADFYLPVDSEGIPNSPLKHVVGTGFDFRIAKPIKQDFLQGEQLAAKGYDHSFIVNKAWQKPCVLLTSPNGDLSLEVLTSQAALQVYTGNFLAGTPTRENREYADYSGIALETQCLPDTPNHPEWQNYGGIVKAGEEYYQWTEYRFKGN